MGIREEMESYLSKKFTKKYSHRLWIPCQWAFELGVKWAMERSASYVERLSPYFKEAPEACYQECVNDVANKLRQLAKEME